MFLLLLPLETMLQSPFVLQSEIKRKTGFGIEQLRKWRQRFGFPPAQYESSGRAIYSRDSVDRLLVIKHLLEAGLRPGQVVANTAAENIQICADLQLVKPVVERRNFDASNLQVPVNLRSCLFRPIRKRRIVESPDTA